MDGIRQQCLRSEVYVALDLFAGVAVQQANRVHREFDHTNGCDDVRNPKTTACHPGIHEAAGIKALTGRSRVSHTRGTRIIPMSAVIRREH